MASVPFECQISALGGKLVCLLKGRGEEERDGGRGRIERASERAGERERERGQGRKLFTSEEPRRKRVLVCVCVCWSGDHAGKNTLANCSELN